MIGSNQTDDAKMCVVARRLLHDAAGRIAAHEHCGEYGDRLIAIVNFGIGRSSPMCSVERPRVSGYRLNAVIGLFT
jgi:hypothetical protein